MTTQDVLRDSVKRSVVGIVGSGSIVELFG